MSFNLVPGANLADLAPVRSKPNQEPQETISFTGSTNDCIQGDITVTAPTRSALSFFHGNNETDIEFSSTFNNDRNGALINMHQTESPEKDFLLEIPQNSDQSGDSSYTGSQVIALEDSEIYGNDVQEPSSELTGINESKLNKDDARKPSPELSGISESELFSEEALNPDNQTVSAEHLKYLRSINIPGVNEKTTYADLKEMNLPRKLLDAGMIAEKNSAQVPLWQFFGG